MKDEERHITDGYAVIRMILPLRQPIGEIGTVWRCFIADNRFENFAYISNRCNFTETDVKLFPKDWRNGEFLIRLHAGLQSFESLKDLQRQAGLAADCWGAAKDPQLDPWVEDDPTYEVTWIESVVVRNIQLGCNDCGNHAVNDATRATLAVAYCLEVSNSAALQQSTFLTTAETVQRAIIIQKLEYETSGELSHATELYPVMPYFMMKREHLGAGEPDDNARGKFVPTLQAISAEHLFSRHLELVAEASEAIYLRGQFSQGLMAAAQGCEYLLDALLHFMMWWEGKSPREGAREFTATGNLIVQRVKASYADRLGSGWKTDEAVLLRWRDDVARPRNRVIHGGRRVTSQEAEAALETAQDLRAFIVELAKSQYATEKYPPLLALLVGDSHLPDTWPGMKGEQFYGRPHHAEDRLRAWVALFQGELSLSTKPSEERANVVVVKNKGGGFEWWLFDPDSHKIVPVDTASVSKDQRKGIEGGIDYLRKGTMREYARVGVNPVPKKRADSSWTNASVAGPGLPWECPWSDGKR